MSLREPVGSVARVIATSRAKQTQLIVHVVTPCIEWSCGGHQLLSELLPGACIWVVLGGNSVLAMCDARSKARAETTVATSCLAILTRPTA